MPETLQKIEMLAQDVMNLSRNTLIINLRFMDKAISMLKCQSIHDLEGVFVDGKNIYYDPLFILKSYSKEKKSTARIYLHMVLHCVYQHFWVSTLVNQEYWNLACDIAVEYTINDIGIDAVQVDQITDKQKTEINRLEKKVKYMTADMLYKYFMTEDLPDKEVKKLTNLFSADAHDLWYSPKKKEELSKMAEGENGEIEHGSNESAGQTGAFDSTSGIIMLSKKETRELLEEWADVAKKMKMDIECFSKSKGSTAGGLTQNLLAVTREKYDYADFLKRFAILGERMKINMDEFDYVFYTYGMRLYGKMPLIEPLEYKEVKQIREFVVAIDTSGSTSGELVQTFLQKTYNILKQQESFFRRFNLHIIQCDSAIQEDAKISTQEEFDYYISNMKIKGMGGTDFRPVFEYVDELVANREFSNLKGLIYFTDGIGAFPTKQPNYNTAFVFVEEGYENPEVPVWAIKLVLQPDDIRGIEQ